MPVKFAVLQHRLSLIGYRTLLGYSIASLLWFHIASFTPGGGNIYTSVCAWVFCCCSVPTFHCRYTQHLVLTFAWGWVGWAIAHFLWDKPTEVGLPPSNTKNWHSNWTSDFDARKREEKATARAAELTSLLCIRKEKHDVYMCLRCRKSGHHIDQCPFPVGADDYGWPSATSYMQEAPRAAVSSSEFCWSCRTLNLLAMFEHPNSVEFQSQESKIRSRPVFFNFRRDWGELWFGDSLVSKKEARLFVDLGYSGSYRFSNDCAMCRLLFDIAPTCDGLDNRLVLVPAWILHRQEPTLSLKNRNAAWATCVYMASLSETQSGYVIFPVIKPCRFSKLESTHLLRLGGGSRAARSLNDHKLIRT